jgi:uncharacterized protein YbaP (TraB family)
MKKLLAAACAAMTLALAAGFATAPVAAEQVKGPPQPSLWVVKDADSTLYLYGTLHLRKPGGEWGGPAAKAAFETAQEVWTELEIDPAKDAQAQSLVFQYGIDPKRKLSEVIDPAQRPALEAAVKALGAPLANFEPMKPWLAGITFSIVPMLQAGYDPASGVDRQIDAAAEAAGKKLRWFETADEQMQFFATLPEPVQLQMLYEALAEFQKGPELIKQMEAAWEAGDDAALQKLVVDDMKTQYPEVYDVLLTKRNQRWADVIEAELRGAGVDFIAVGGAHLLGADSVQAFLEKKGIRAEQIAP